MSLEYLTKAKNKIPNGNVQVKTKKKKKHSG
jgi:hypothetical protein